MNITYRDKIITYNEASNEWHCEDLGSHRGSPSLTLAKARIDKMLDSDGEKPKPFATFKLLIYQFGYHPGWQEITITGKAEKGLWATNGKERKKLDGYDIGRCKELTALNCDKVAKIKELNSKIDALQEQIEAVEDSMTPYKP